MKKEEIMGAVFARSRTDSKEWFPQQNAFFVMPTIARKQYYMKRDFFRLCHNPDKNCKLYGPQTLSTVHISCEWQILFARRRCYQRHFSVSKANPTCCAHILFGGGGGDPGVIGLIGRDMEALASFSVLQIASVQMACAPFSATAPLLIPRVVAACDPKVARGIVRSQGRASWSGELRPLGQKSNPFLAAHIPSPSQTSQTLVFFERPS